MKSFIFFAALGAVSASSLQRRSYPLALLESRAVTLSPDNSCGASSTGNYSCGATNAGPCCSGSGYCGNSTAYCGSGCQSAYGTCSTGAAAVDPNLCGPNNSNNKCQSGSCCSSAGYCGTTDAYCGAGCQSAFGTCTSGSSSSSSSSSTPVVGGSGSSSSSGSATQNTASTTASVPRGTATLKGTVSTDGTCGATYGNKICPAGQCCSPSGYCGTTEDYCADPGCDYKHGVCDSNQTPSGASTANVKRTRAGAVSYTDDIYKCTQPKMVAMTFDDGPYIWTSQLLDILKQYGATATFFITGNNIGKGSIDTTWSDIIKRMDAEGHQIASHTWSHYNLTDIGKAMRYDQMVKNEMAFVNIVGKFPTYMRPPFSECRAGSGCPEDMAALGYHRIYFDMDTQDYLNPTTIVNSQNIVTQLLTSLGPNDDGLAIQHDIVQASVQNLTAMFLAQIYSKGWRATTVGECMDDPVANWYRRPDGSIGDGSTHFSASSSAVPSINPTSTLSATGVLSSVTSIPGGAGNGTTGGSLPTSVMELPSASTAHTTVSVSSSSTTSSTSNSTPSSTSGSTTTAKMSTLTTSTSSSSSISSTTSRSTTSTTSTSTSKSSSSSSTRTTTSATKTTTSASATATCLVKAGTFCGTIGNFTNATGCYNASDDCSDQLWDCISKSGMNMLACSNWYTKVCSPLTTYCFTCGNTCNRANFKPAV